MAPLTINLPRATLAAALAGALAESSTSPLTLTLPGKPPLHLSPRTTDLPALLRSAPDATLLTTPQGCTILLTRDGCSIDTPSALLLEALGRISR